MRQGGYQDDPVSIRRELRILKGKVYKVIGLDIDPIAKQNPFVDEIHLMADEKWPLDNDSADLVLCDNVLEHLEKPETFFLECKRVLRNKGYVCIRTPNLYHYVGLFAKFIPTEYQYALLSRIQKGRKEIDIFPKFYRCNTIPRLRSLLKRFGFRDVIVYGYEAEPSYLEFARFCYFLGTIYQKFAPRCLASTIFAFAILNKRTKEMRLI